MRKVHVTEFIEAVHDAEGEVYERSLVEGTRFIDLWLDTRTYKVRFQTVSDTEHPQSRAWYIEEMC